MLNSLRSVNFIARRTLSQRPGGSKTSTVNRGKAKINASASGLSSKCVKSVTSPVGPGAAPDAAYKVPEYFSFNRFTFTEAEVELAKYRCPQPSAVNK